MTSGIYGTDIIMQSNPPIIIWTKKKASLCPTPRKYSFGGSSKTSTHTIQRWWKGIDIQYTCRIIRVDVAGDLRNFRILDKAPRET